jgi:hypothetical protein
LTEEGEAEAEPLRQKKTKGKRGKIRACMVQVDKV